MNNKQKEDTATLEILQAIENNKEVTQRHLADRLDVALGLTNSYLKRCVNKGLIKIHQAPANRYFYYITPKGFTEKSRLTAQYLSSSFDFYRKAANSVCDTFVECRKKGLQKIAFYGVSELAEIASLKLHDFELEHMMTFDEESRLEMFLGKSVYKSISESRGVDAYLITSLSGSKQILERLEKTVDSERILVPSILGLNRW